MIETIMLNGITMGKTILVILIILVTILIGGCFESEGDEWAEIKEKGDAAVLAVGH